MIDPTTREVSVLTVGARDWLIDWAADHLSTAGHRVLRCHEPGEPPFPCNAFIPGRTCPMRDGAEVVLTIRLHARPRLLREELGVLCGRSHGLPLVVAGTSWSNPAGLEAARYVGGEATDIVIACQEEAEGSQSHDGAVEWIPRRWVGGA